MDNWMTHIYERMLENMTLQELELYIEKLRPGFRTDWNDHYMMYIAIFQRRELMNKLTMLTPELIRDLERVNKKLCLIQVDLEQRLDRLYRQWVGREAKEDTSFSYISFSVSIPFEDDIPISILPKDMQNADSDFDKMFGILSTVVDVDFSIGFYFDSMNSELVHRIDEKDITAPELLLDCGIPFCTLMLDLLDSNMFSFSDIIRISKFNSYAAMSLQENYSRKR